MPRERNDRPSENVLRLVLSAALVLVAFLITEFPAVVYHIELSPFLLFFPAVLLSALFGGLRPGLLATILSTAITGIWLCPDGEAQEPKYFQCSGALRVPYGGRSHQRCPPNGGARQSGKENKQGWSRRWTICELESTRRWKLCPMRSRSWKVTTAWFTPIAPLRRCME